MYIRTYVHKWFMQEFLTERQNMQAKIDHLQEAVRTHFSALTTLKQHASNLREEKEKSDQLVCMFVCMYVCMYVWYCKSSL